MKHEQDKALFDFDQDIDDLEHIDERYPAGGIVNTNTDLQNELLLDEDKENKNASNTDTK